MANIKQTMDELMRCDGAMCAALVDYNSGMILGQDGSGVDLEPCLLYTSPSPRDLSTSRMPSSA